MKAGWTARATAAAVGALLLTGCFAGSSDDDTTGSTSGDGDTVSLRLAHGWTGEVPQARAFEPAVERFQEEHPEIDLTVETAAGNEIKTLVSSDMAAGREPDVFLHWGTRDTSPYVEDDRLADLTDYLDENPEIRDRYEDGAFDSVTWDGRVYGLPIGAYAQVLLINEAVMDAAGVEPPADEADVLRAVEELVAADVIPLAVNGTAERYLFELFLARELGADGLDGVATGDAATRDAIAAAAAKVMELRSAGAFPEGAETLQTLQALELYNSGAAAMFYNETWTIGNLAESVIETTTLSTYPGEDVRTLAGAGYYVYISADAWADENRREAALTLAEYLAGPEVNTDLVDISWYPSPMLAEQLDVDTAALPPLVQDMLQTRTDAVASGEFADKLDEKLTAGAFESLTSLSERLFIGELTPEQFADELLAATAADPARL